MSRDRSNDPPKTAAELMADLESDPEYVARMKSQQEQRLKAVEQSLRNAKPILLDLASAGFYVDSVADLFNRKMNYEKAIPILLSWLTRITDPAVKEDVIRALTVPWAKPTAALPLIQEFRRAADSSSAGFQWAIANALSVVADDSVFDDVVQLVRDGRNGKAREMFALALGNMKNPQAVRVLTDLLGDAKVVGHAVMALGILKANDARSSVEKLASDPKKWIRKEVQKALAQMDSPGQGL